MQDQPNAFSSLFVADVRAEVLEAYDRTEEALRSAQRVADSSVIAAEKELRNALDFLFRARVALDKEDS